jgi:hypothetical protein
VVEELDAGGDDTGAEGLAMRSVNWRGKRPRLQLPVSM